MALVCIILALLIERSLTALDRLRNFHWFDVYSYNMMRRLPGIDKQGAASIIILLLPVLIPAGILQYYLSDLFYDLFSFVYSLVILSYCLGSNINRDIKLYIQAREAGDLALAQDRKSTRLNSSHQ